MSKGTYGLGIELAEDRTIEVGALGELRFDVGGYVYVGSAFGPGGFSRIDRHREMAVGERATRHWHIDYLLSEPATTLVAVGKVSGVDCECAIAGSLPGTSMEAFGASDCDCASHLVAIPTEQDLQSILADAYETVELG